ncbi:hypothetical protein BM221_007300 [Beauveria bassiana]|uniref:Uncharacterized protein n=1 Tax=Beauveria bassiana TaxID=176275 RepID=A0A2N6NGA0_BEABA|nr:hypothetical protein BM221_007300 [Beauveria bassiana]
MTQVIFSNLLSAVSVPQSTGEKPLADLDGSVIEHGVELDSNFIVDLIFEILSNYITIPDIPEPAVTVCQAPPTHPTAVTAEVAAKMKASAFSVLIRASLLLSLALHPTRRDHPSI